MSSRRGHREVARLLCGAGADKDKAMQTRRAFHHVVRCRHLEVYPVLLYTLTYPSCSVELAWPRAGAAKKAQQDKAVQMAQP